MIMKEQLEEQPFRDSFMDGLSNINVVDLAHISPSTYPSSPECSCAARNYDSSRVEEPSCRSEA